MPYHVIHAAGHAWAERPGVAGQEPRRLSDVTTAAGLTQSRARVWRIPPHVRGSRHFEKVQEEVFVVISGTLTMLLGDPPDRVDLAPCSVVSVEPGTPLQMRNETDEEIVVFAYGAPPVTGQAEHLGDIEL